MTKGRGRLLISPSLANEMICVLSKHSITATSFNTNGSNQTNDITLNLKRQAGNARSECKWEAPFLTMRKEHTGTFNKDIKTSLIYFWPSFNHRVKNTTLMFLFTHKIQASKQKELLLMNPAWPSQQKLYGPDGDGVFGGAGVVRQTSPISGLKQPQLPIQGSSQQLEETRQIETRISTSVTFPRNCCTSLSALILTSCVTAPPVHKND